MFDQEQVIQHLKKWTKCVMNDKGYCIENNCSWHEKDSRRCWMYDMNQKLIKLNEKEV